MKLKNNQNANYRQNSGKRYLVKLDGYGKIGLKNQKQELIVLENGYEIELTESDIQLLKGLNIDTDKVLTEIF